MTSCQDTYDNDESGCFFVRFGQIYPVKEGAGPKKQEQSLMPALPLLVTDTILGVTAAATTTATAAAIRSTRC